MSPAAPKPARPLPISTTQTARGLLRIYSRLKGELVKARTGEDVTDAVDQQEEATLRMRSIHHAPCAQMAVGGKRQSSHLDFAVPS